MNSPPNPLGLYDMGGNIKEWVDDWFNETQRFRVLRGGSFTCSLTDQLVSSWRHIRDYASPPKAQKYGFRCVLEAGANTPVK